MLSAVEAIGAGGLGVVVGAAASIAMAGRSPAPASSRPSRQGPGAASWEEGGPRRRRANRSVLVTLASGACFVAVALRLGVSDLLPAYWCFVAALVVLTAVDVGEHRIPNRVVYPALLAAVPLLGAPALAVGHWGRLFGAAVGGLGAFLALAVFHLARPGALGFGDLRMSGLIGCYLGFLDLALVPLALGLAVLMAGLAGVALLASGRTGSSDRMALAPFLAAAALVALLWGKEILRLWLG